MENQPTVSVKGVSVKYGLINGLLAIIFFVVLDLAGLSGESSLSWIGIVITAVIIYFAHKSYISDGDGFMTYGEGLKIGTLLCLISSLISSLFTLLYISFINTSFIENMREIQIAAMEEQGLTDSQIEQAMQFTEFLSSPMALFIFGIVGGVIAGFLVSLIVSLITKKPRPEFE